ncbi:MAG: sigma-70 family RNA polymerase sigma factor [Bacteroidales bacterium]|nr:sigma-70 family RNA polymerase sigma factor [Lentimicrobiaceae bacterium]MDD5696167.1 sigma-70 family RNA polymerase sigma factor [Bacteroidales bacterium]
MMDSFSEARIIDGFYSAENGVLEYIYREYLPSVIHMVKSNHGAPIDAEDLFQDALVVAFEKIQAPDFALSCTFKTYLYSICRNLWMHRLEKMNKEFIPYEMMENTLSGYNEQDKLFLEEEKDKLFHDHFLRLGEKCQKILLLVFQRFSTSEIAVKLELNSELYVRKRKSQCRKTLIRNIVRDPKYIKIKNHRYEERP